MALRLTQPITAAGIAAGTKTLSRGTTTADFGVCVDAHTL
jgi:hypothetical protein